MALAGSEPAALPQYTPTTPAGRRVLDAASRLFYDRGINSVGMDLLAEEAGVTKKTIYDRFGSKEILVAAYLYRRDRYWREWLTGRLDPEAPAGERILATYDALDEWLHHENPRGCAMVNATVEITDPDHPGRAVVRSQKQWMRELYADMAREAGLDGPDAAGGTLLILGEGATTAFSSAGVEEAARLARDTAARLYGL